MARNRLTHPVDTATLKTLTLFADVPELVLGKLAVCVQTRHAEEGSFFFMEGDPAAHIYVLESGQVKLLQTTPDGQQVAMRIVLPGQMFAGIAMLNPHSGYQVSAQAMSDSVACVWAGSDFRRLADQYPQLSINIMQLMRAYVQEMQARYREMATERVKRRVARALIRLVSMSAALNNPAAPVSLALSRQDLAEMSGTTLFTVSRLLSDWERRGLLTLGREKVTIVHPHGLVRIAEDLDT